MQMFLEGEQDLEFGMFWSTFICLPNLLLLRADLQLQAALIAHREYLRNDSN